MSTSWALIFCDSGDSLMSSPGLLISLLRVLTGEPRSSELCTSLSRSMSRAIWAFSCCIFRVMSLKHRYQAQPETPPLPRLSLVDVDILAARPPEPPDIVSHRLIFSCTSDAEPSLVRFLLEACPKSPTCIDFRRGAACMLRSTGCADFRRGLSTAQTSLRAGCRTCRCGMACRLFAELVDGDDSVCKAFLCPAGSSQATPAPSLCAVAQGGLFSLSGLPEVSLKTWGTVEGEPPRESGTDSAREPRCAGEAGMPESLETSTREAGGWDC
mmetsp:Transcript_46736/g.87368  ORF Transcript_46736/g.87368 Transcript_46736/m.87368 type:complete len:270 (-) Transcript_46736:97-906(-)